MRKHSKVPGTYNYDVENRIWYHIPFESDLFPSRSTESDFFFTLQLERNVNLLCVVTFSLSWRSAFYSFFCLTGPLSSPLSNFEIRVGILTDHKQNPMCGDRVRQLGAGEVWTAECKPPIPGQHVSVSMVGKGYLAICEVAVFARLGEWHHNY